MRYRAQPRIPTSHSLEQGLCLGPLEHQHHFVRTTPYELGAGGLDHHIQGVGSTPGMERSTPSRSHVNHRRLMLSLRQEAAIGFP